VSFDLARPLWTAGIVVALYLVIMLSFRSLGRPVTWPLRVIAVSLVAVAMTLLLPRQVGAAPKDALLSVGLDPATRASGVD
jgi:peptidoglycan/LPS O-acetylase OafA/YrhL